MELARQFPATTWVWRSLTSRPAKRVWLALGIALVLLTSGLRIYAAIFEHRVTAVLSGMAQLRLDRTTKSEMLARVPVLRPGLPDGAICHPDECYSVELRNWPGDSGLPRLTLLLGPLGRWLGVRYWRFTAVVGLREGRVRDISYHLLVDNFTHQYPGFLLIRLSSTRGYRYGYLSAFEDESPEYRVTHYFKWPDLDTEVVFTPAAPPWLVQHAFDVRLNCIWSLRGCRTVTQVLPSVENDRRAIEQAALARVHSSDPCPDEILPHRARDVSDILLAEVKSVGPELSEEGYGRYRLVDFDLLEVLKGKVHQPLHSVRFLLNTYEPGSGREMPDPDAKSIRPGARVLMFSDIGGPCQTVEATDSALQTIRKALAAGASEVPEEDRTF